MDKSHAPVDPQQARMDTLRARLRSLDLRIARMREQHAGSSDPLAHRLLKYSAAERDELRAKLQTP